MIMPPTPRPPAPPPQADAYPQLHHTAADDNDSHNAELPKKSQTVNTRGRENGTDRWGEGGTGRGWL